jgi:hypothetical protein
VRADYKAVKEEIWIIEGMARAVEESYFVAGMKRSQRFGNELHPVDISLRDEFWSYQAQDFWVYAGQAGGEDIGYLRQILTWGASTESVKAGMPVLGFSFPEMVWKWSKNQMMEKAIDTDGTLGTPCILDHAHPVADPDNFYHIFDWYTATGTIPPLTSAVVTIGWSFNPGPLWVIELYSNGNPSHEVKYKVYVEGENICDGSIPDGPRKLTFLPGITYYVLLTNTSDTAPHDFNVIVGG